MKLEMMDRLGKSGLSIGQFILENSGTITYNDYRGAKAEFDELRNVRDNARKLYRDSRGREKEQSHER